MLSSVEIVSFYGFLMALTKHPAVNTSVGKFLILMQNFFSELSMLLMKI